MSVASNALFPGYNKALDQSIVSGLFQERYCCNIDSCKILDTKYVPNVKCTILYEIEFNGASHYFFADLLPNKKLNPETPEKAFWIEELNAIFHPFPFDPVMTWLPLLMDQNVMRKKIEYHFPARKVLNLGIKSLEYRPQMRATFNYDILFHDNETNRTERAEWIAKTNVHKDSSRVFGNYIALYKASAGRVPMPRPVTAFLDPKVTFQEKIQGIRLGAIVSDPSFDQIVENVSSAIAHFHQLKFPLNNRRQLQQEIHTLNRSAEVLKTFCPEYLNRINILTQSISSQLELRFKISSPIHADFHHSNILVNGTEIQLIDMDDIALGDPCLDIGRFLSSLRLPSLRAFGTFEALEVNRDKFLETYLKNNSLDIRNIRLFEAASLITSAASAFRFQRANWQSEVALFISEAEKMLDLATLGKNISVNPQSEKKQQLSLQERLEWSLDENYFKTILAPHYFKKYQSELASCRLVKKEEKGSGVCLTYSVEARNGSLHYSRQLLCQLHSEKSGMEQFSYLEDVAALMEGKFLPAPIAYLPQINAVVSEAFSGNTLLLAAEGVIAQKLVEQFAKKLAGFHLLKKNIQPEKTYVLMPLNWRRIKVFEGEVLVTGPVRMKLGDPNDDIDGFMSFLKDVGIQKGKTSEYEKLAVCFKEKYKEHKKI